MYDLIAFLALNRDLHTFIALGAWFQALVESFIKEFRLLVDFPSIIFPDETDLEVLNPVSVSIFFTLLLAYAGRLTYFHISVSFIFAFSWLTEHMIKFLSMVLVGTLSDIFDLFRNLRSLFCAFWSSQWVLVTQWGWHMPLRTQGQEIRWVNKKE